MVRHERHADERDTIRRKGDNPADAVIPIDRRLIEAEQPLAAVRQRRVVVPEPFQTEGYDQIRRQGESAIEPGVDERFQPVFVTRRVVKHERDDRLARRGDEPCDHRSADTRYRPSR